MVSVGQSRGPKTSRMGAEAVSATVIGVGTAEVPYLPSSKDRETCRVALSSLVRQFGAEMCDDPAEVEASLLREFQRDIALVVAAQREGVPARLLAAVRSGSVTASADEAVQHLVESCQLSEDDARFAVDSWALALGLAGH